MQIKNVGVVGCGVMGSGIAQVCAQSDYEVVVMEKDPAFLKKGLSAIDAFLKKGIEKGKVSEAEKTSILERIKGTTQYENFHDCDLVIEAVVEDIRLKKEIFESLDKVCGAHAIFASNTSSLSIIDLARATKREEKFLGLHFFNPVPLMQLIEVVTSLVTSDETLEIGKAFGASLGKTVIVAKDTPGFIVNYLQLPFRLNAIRMLEAGMATKEDIDAAATLGLGHPMGPLTLQDLVGLDVTYAAALSIYEATRDPVFAPPVLMQKMIAAGLLGRKTGKGFYEYK
jgi:3-hydroxybutyryl-CoA dehydrogenase